MVSQCQLWHFKGMLQPVWLTSRHQLFAFTLRLRMHSGPRVLHSLQSSFPGQAVIHRVSTMNQTKTSRSPLILTGKTKIKNKKAQRGNLASWADMCCLSGLCVSVLSLKHYPWRKHWLERPQENHGPHPLQDISLEARRFWKHSLLHLCFLTSCCSYQMVLGKLWVGQNNESSLGDLS